MEVVASVVEKIGEYLAGVVVHQIGYLFKYGDNINNLKEEAKNLEAARSRVQGQIEVAGRNGEEIEVDVRNWDAKVEAIWSKASKLLEDEAKANNTCLKGWCVNLRSRYHFSKRAAKMTLEITKLKDAGKFERVSHPPPPPGIISSSPAHSGDFESRKKVIEEILEALNDESTWVIGICGMGGVGKTVMVKQIGKQAKENKQFNEVAMAVVSENPNVTKIRKDLADMLGLKLADGNELHRAGLLCNRIKKDKSILIILDDVWKRLALEAVGIPLGTDHAGCKIVLTSRSQDVCDQMDVQKIFPLSALSPEEAWVLFREKAGEVVDSSDLNGIARDVARECGGLPLAIVTVARALKSRNKDVWIDAALQLKTSAPTDIGGLHSDVFPKIELSFNFLESKVAKSCFLLCCMFPEDWNIGVEDLVRYGMGLRLFEGVDTIEQARGRVHTAVSTLTASFLLLDGDNANEVCVKMHDVVRDVAISIARKDEQNRLMVKAGIGLRNWPDTETFESYSGISLISNDIRELPSGLECPKLQTLLLSHSRRSLQIPNDFFRGMKDLKVLDMTYMRLKSQPFNCESLQFLTVLRTLYLHGITVADFSIIGSLKTLEILIISSPFIHEIPQDIEGLTRLRLFDLRGYSMLSKIAQGVLPRLGKLEELYAGFTSEFWRYGINGNAELRSLGSRLTCLSFWTPIDANELPENLHFPHLTRFSITIGRNGHSRHPPEYRRSLSIEGDLRIPVTGWIKELFEKTRVS